MGKKYLKARWLCFSLLAVFAGFAVSGCGQKPAAGPQTVEVKAVQVMKRDTPITYEFVGQVIAKDEVQIRARVSGNIIAKMVAGGATVTAGQPLFQIDRRPYESAALAAQASLAQSEASLANARRDFLRYQTLADQNAIARQTLDTQMTMEQQNEAVVDANRARVQQAADDLSDTLIVAPMSGRVDVNDLAVGNFVTAGSTVLATMSSVDPVLVQFSMSENEYLKFVQLKNGASPQSWGNDLHLILSDGSQYPQPGHIEQVDKGLAQNTGTLTMKAVFTNPQKILIPGMFARVATQGEVRPGALLIPQRAVQQLLGKTVVTVVGAEDKAETRAVTMGPRVGTMWVVEDGLSEADRVVVEGFAKVIPGSAMKVVMMAPEDVEKTPKQ